MLQLKRFSYTDAQACKIQHPVALTTTVRLPCFVDEGPQVRHDVYMVSAVIIHLGDTLATGHYRALLHQGEGRWAITDDGRTASLATADDMVTAQQNSYLLFCTRRIWPSA